MPKISELNAITSVANTDLLMVVHDPSGSPSTNKITVSNFGSSLTRTINIANNTSAGVIKVGENLTINATGFLNAQSGGGTEGVYPFVTINNANNYVVSNTDVMIFVDPNGVAQNFRVILPTVGVATGQEFLIKNINTSLDQYTITVTTDAGEEFGSNYLENPITGAFSVNFDFNVRGESHTWIYDGTAYRHLADLSPAPIFYSSTSSYHQVVLQNPSDANNASSDWVAYNDDGNFTEGTGPFIDMGINSSQYTDTTYGNVWKENDSYVYNYGGDLVIGPQTDNTIKFIAGGTNEEDVRMTISSSDITVNSNIHVTQSYFDIYGNNSAEISASTDGLGSGPQQAYVWAYQDGDSDVQTGMYSQNSSSESQFVHYPDGRIVFSGYNGIQDFGYNYIIRPYNAYSVGIRPSDTFGNELVINPTADYDIHLYEGNTGGAITLGNPGHTQFRVYGPGGNDAAGTQGNNIIAELTTGATLTVKVNGEEHLKVSAYGLTVNGDIKNSDGFSVIKSIQQNQQSSLSDYTLVISDAGKHIYKDDADGYSVLVPTNANVPFEIGTVITVVSGDGWTYIQAANTATTDVWGAGFNQVNQNWYIPNNSMATLLKIDTDKWMLSGAGLAID